MPVHALGCNCRELTYSTRVLGGLIYLYFDTSFAEQTTRASDGRSLAGCDRLRPVFGGLRPLTASLWRVATAYDRSIVAEW